MSPQPKVRIHKTAVVEKGVRIGPYSTVWDSVHIRPDAVLGHHVTVGEKTYIAYDVRIGNYVKINAFVYIPTGVTIEDRVMLSAGCIFVNDRYPRAFDLRTGSLYAAGPTDKTLRTTVREGATIGAAATVLADLEIGRYALVGAGSVVTRSVPDFAIVAGNPARRIGWICACGSPLRQKTRSKKCADCGRRYRLIRQVLREIR